LNAGGDKKLLNPGWLISATMPDFSQLQGIHDQLSNRNNGLTHVIDDW
jgi:hypothetical protein